MAESRFERPAPERTIPQQRVIQKLDGYMAQRDYAGAERHLKYWLEEACALADARGELMVRNELIGHFRKTGDKSQALAHADAALRLLDELGMAETITAGTTYTNAATACNAFGENERALELFRKAAAVYEASPYTEARLLGGLYNNMGLACVALRRFDEADGLFAKALSTMGNVEGGELEQAITYLNMADALRARTEAQAASYDVADADADDAAAACEKTISSYLDTALDLLDAPTVARDGYYAFVCEKCAPVFGYYGYFLADRDLRERAEAIYERA